VNGQPHASVALPLGEGSPYPLNRKPSWGPRVGLNNVEKRGNLTHISQFPLSCNICLNADPLEWSEFLTVGV